MTCSAPTARAVSHFSGPPAVATTVPPRARTSCTSSCPTPPAAACTSATSPGLTAYVLVVRYWAVRPWSMTAAAFSRSTPSGTFTRADAGRGHLDQHLAGTGLRGRPLLDGEHADSAVARDDEGRSGGVAHPATLGR